MPSPRAALLTLVVVTRLLAPAPAAAQRPWLEVQAPHVRVLSDGSEGQARNVAWQFEQVREAVAQVFPWVRVDGAVPLLVIGARNEGSMRAMAPEFWEKGQQGLVSLGTHGADRNYILLRADVREDDREGINPYQPAYWAYAANALRDTSPALPLWLVRGLASVISNTLVRDEEVQVGRVLPQHIRHLRTRSRLSLEAVVAHVDAEPSLDALEALDAHAWAFVHFLAFANKRAYAPLLDKYVMGVLAGADPVASLAETLGDVSRFETPFAVYVDRDIYAFFRFGLDAGVTREGLAARPVTPGESAALRAAFQASRGSRAAVDALAAEADAAGPAGLGAEARALLADAERRDADLRPQLEQAVAQPTASWYAPYRLATLLPTEGTAALQQVEALLAQATQKNPSADRAWSYLGEVQAALGRTDAALASVQQAIRLQPAASRHRLSLARVWLRAGRYDDALKAGGTARALARGATERNAAQGVLAEVATRVNRVAAEREAVAAAAAAAAAPAPAVGPAAAFDTAAAASASSPPAPGAGPVAGGRSPAASRESLTTVMTRCAADSDRCGDGLPAMIAACEDARHAMGKEACTAAGTVLDEGLGLVAEPERAAGFYRRGCQRGDELACVRLAALQVIGRGVARDEVAGLAVLEPACSKGLAEACGRLALILINRNGPGDGGRGMDLLKKSCAAGDQGACTLLKQLSPG